MNILNLLKRNNVLLKNFTSLSLLQISNFLFPIITLPYLVRTLGPSNFGLISFAIAFMSYFAIIIDYGFNLSATKSISINKGNKNRISEIFSSIIQIKITLFLICAFLFLIIINSFQIFASEKLLFTITYTMIIGNILFPLWFFQGIQEMKYITIIHVVVRSISVILTFIIIKNKNDYLNYLWLNSSMNIIIGIIGLLVAVGKFKIKLSLIPSINYIKQLKDGFYLFLSVISISLYTTSSTFILGLFASSEIVGYFSAADKIRSAIQGFYSAISQSVYPHLSSLFKQNSERAYKFAGKLLILVGAITFIISVLTLLFSKNIVILVLGDTYMSSIAVLKILSFVPFIIMVGNIPGIQVMLNNGMTKSFLKIIIVSAIINLIFSFYFVPVFYEIGTALSMLLVESIVTIGFFYEIKKNGISLY